MAQLRAQCTQGAVIATVQMATSENCNTCEIKMDSILAMLLRTSCIEGVKYNITVSKSQILYICPVAHLY